MEENKKNQPKNENVPTVPAPDYKRLYEEQTTNLNDANDYISRLQIDNEKLEKELADTKDKLASTTEHNLRNFRKADILKNAIKAIMENKDMKFGDVCELLLDSNEIDFDNLLLALSK